MFLVNDDNKKKIADAVNKIQIWSHFRDETRSSDKASLFRQSVQYYINGTNDGFLKYKTRPQHGMFDNLNNI